MYELPTSRLRWFISLQAAPPSALPNYYSGILIPPERDNATHMILTGITLTASIAFSAGAPALPLAVATLVGVVKKTARKSFAGA